MSLLVRDEGTCEQGRPLLICFSHLRWDFVFQRPQHLLTRAATEYEVIFIEEPRYVEGSAPSLDIRTDKHGVQIVVPVLHGDHENNEADIRMLIDAFIEGFGQERKRVLWYYTPMALSFSHHHKAAVTIYDNMDELSAFRGASPKMLENEKALLERADLVFCGGASLYQAKRDKHPRVYLFPSSVDAEHFRAARLREGPQPDDQVGIEGPRLGYFGVIDERIDLSLLDAVAVARPGWQIIMIGPVVKIDPNSLPKRPNIHWLGMKPYEALPNYLAGWNVGIMPFALNESTRYISPTKTPEFLAAGLPLVSTAIADVVDPYGTDGFVTIAHSAEEFVAGCESHLGGLSELAIKRVDKLLAGGSWNKTWQEMSKVLSEMTVQANPDVSLQNRLANV